MTFALYMDSSTVDAIYAGQVVERGSACRVRRRAAARRLHVRDSNDYVWVRRLSAGCRILCPCDVSWQATIWTLSLSLLGLAPNAFLAAIDRLGLTCYEAVYAVNNIANSIGMVVTDALTSAVAAELGFLNALLCAAPSLLVCTPVFLQKEIAKAAVH